MTSTQAATTRKEQALWLLEQLVPGKGVNNLSLAFRVNGRLDLEALRSALDVLVRRHEVLRTVYRVDGVALVKDTAGAMPVVIERGSPVDVQDALTRFVSRPFPLDGRQLVRAAYFESPAGDHFCLAAHHLIFDTISAGILAEELVRAYETLVAGRDLDDLLTEVPVLPEPEPAEASLAFWREHLRGFEPGGLELWCGEPDVADPTLAGSNVTYELSEQARTAVRELQRRLRAPEAVVLAAAYYLLLAAHGAGPDMVVGSPVNIRTPEHARAIGYHVNVLPLRVGVDFEEDFATLVRRTRDVFFDAFSHAAVSVDILSAELNRVGSAWRDTLFRHLFNYVPEMGLPPFKIDGMTAEPVVVENVYSKFDLEFFVMSSAQAIKVRAVHYSEVLSRRDVELLVRRYEALLLAVGARADLPVRELRIWSDDDIEIIRAANQTARPDQPRTVLDAVWSHVTNVPSAVVVEAGDRRSTYRQVWDAAIATSRRLAQAGVQYGDVVAIATPRAAELVSSVLGVWLAGAVYLPVDLGHPAQRVTYLLTDSGTKAVLAHPDAPIPAGVRCTTIPVVQVSDDEPTGVAESSVLVDPLDTAYLIYTSGSTGQPKGTLITHRGLANVAAHFAEELDVGPSDGMLWMTTFAFDMCGLELYLPLVSGGRMVVGPDEARTDGQVLAGLLAEHDVDILQATPTTWRLVLDHVEGMLAGKRTITGGEPVPARLARRLVEAGTRVHHLYGPTETTIWSTSSVLDGHVPDQLDVGRPIRNTVVFIADPAGRELPIGVRGDLCIAGSGVGAGYHDRPELTAERFGEHPVHGRFYRTGDMARWRPDGTIELLGRVDRQVKLRGNRIELGEVESVLGSHPEVAAAAVVMVGDPGADAILTAFVETTASLDDLWEHARAQLPPSAVPNEFVPVDSLPVNANQKVDYPALVGIAGERRASVNVAASETRAAAEDDGPTEILLSLWRDLLGRGDVTAESNFFANGGHSLLGVQLVQRVEEVTGVRLALSELFGSPTPQALAERLRGA